MNNFATLYRYECRKLLQKKLVWVTFLLMAVMILFSFCLEFVGDYYVDGVPVDTNYNMSQMEKAYAQALSGRAIGQPLLEETIAAYRTIPENPERHYTLTPEYQHNARPYSPVFNFIHGTTSMQPTEVRLTWQPSEEDLYGKRLEFMKDLMEDYSLSEGEMAFWENREEQISKPIVFEENGAYDKLLSVFQTVGILELLMVSISLAGIFYDEHTRKTDQIILACPQGQGKLYWAKIAAGTSFSLVSAMLLFIAALGAAFCLYGTQGFTAAFQLICPRNSDPITCGQAILIAYGCMLLASATVGVFVMVLSELIRSNMGAMAVSTGFAFLAMILNVPEQYRVLAQIWDWLPWSFLAPWNVFGFYTLPLLGQHLTPWQAVPMLYLTGSIVMVLAGRTLYRKYQISGR